MQRHRAAPSKCRVQGDAIDFVRKASLFRRQVRSLPSPAQELDASMHSHLYENRQPKGAMNKKGVWSSMLCGSLATENVFFWCHPALLCSFCFEECCKLAILRMPRPRYAARTIWIQARILIITINPACQCHQLTVPALMQCIVSTQANTFSLKSHRGWKERQLLHLRQPLRQRFKFGHSTGGNI